MQKKPWKNDAIAIAKIVIGSILYALSVVWFIDPVHIIPGSITGIGVVLKAVLGFPIGQLNFIINVPLVIIGTIVLGKRLLIYTGLTVFLTSLLMDKLAFIQPFTNDVMLASIFGGVIMGIGLGLILDGGGTTGGTTLVGRLISKKYPHVPMGDILMVGDFIIIMGGSFVLKDWDLLLYSLIDLYVCVVVINVTMYGFKKQCLSIIHTGDNAALLDQIKENGLGRILHSDDDSIIALSKKRNVSKIQHLAQTLDSESSCTSYEANYTDGDLYKDIKVNDEN